MCRRKWVFPAIRHAKTSLVLSDNESPLSPGNHLRA
jgi:hypothetical protein